MEVDGTSLSLPPQPLVESFVIQAFRHRRLLGPPPLRGPKLRWLLGFAMNPFILPTAGLSSPSHTTRLSQANFAKTPARA